MPGQSSGVGMHSSAGTCPPRRMRRSGTCPRCRCRKSRRARARLSVPPVLASRPTPAVHITNSYEPSHKTFSLKSIMLHVQCLCMHECQQATGDGTGLSPRSGEEWHCSRAHTGKLILRNAGLTSSASHFFMAGFSRGAAYLSPWHRYLLSWAAENACGSSRPFRRQALQRRQQLRSLHPSVIARSRTCRACTVQGYRAGVMLHWLGSQPSTHSRTQPCP